MNRVCPFTSTRIKIVRSRMLAHTAALLAGLLLGFGALRAQTPASAIQGRVLNGTTHRPVPNVKVEYVALQQGMVPVATAVTDREGRFRLEDAKASRDSPALLRVEYQGATYSKPLVDQQSRSDSVDIQVFDTSQQPSLVSVKEQAIFLHPAGETLLVLEQVLLENRSNPPRTYVNPQGTYAFTLPGRPREGVRVSVEGPAGMPINQTPVPGKKENSFAIAYAIRPGETQVRLEYSLDYQSPFDFAKPLDQPAEQTHVVTPGKDVQVTGETLVAMGTDRSTGFTGYQVTPIGNVVRLQVSGQAPERSSVERAEAAGESGGLVTIPDPVSRRRWLILALTGLVMLGGFVYHYTR